MLCFHHHTHALGTDGILDRLGNLFDQPLLDLQPAGKHIHNAGDLADPQYPVGGNIADMAYAEKRQHVVFAKTVKLYIAHNDHIIGFSFEDRTMHHIFELLLIAAEQILIAAGHAVRSRQQALALRIIAGCTDNHLSGVFKLIVSVHFFNPFHTPLHSITCIT